MITYEQFEKSINTLIKMAEMRDSLEKFGLCIDSSDGCVHDFIQNYLDNLAAALGLSLEKDAVGYTNDLDYWYYELNHGNLVDKYFDPKKDPEEYEGFGTNLKKVYNFLISHKE